MYVKLLHVYKQEIKTKQIFKWLLNFLCASPKNYEQITVVLAAAGVLQPIWNKTNFYDPDPK